MRFWLELLVEVPDMTILEIDVLAEQYAVFHVAYAQLDGQIEAYRGLVGVLCRRIGYIVWLIRGVASTS